MADLYGGRGAAPLPPDWLDFYSDTKSRPTRQMREAVLDAPVGDEQKGQDPTTRQLLDRVAELLGKEDAIFTSSGTMSNEIALAVHCRPGDEVICERTSHLVNYEAGGASAISGAQIHPLNGEFGMFTADQVAAALRPKGSLYLPETALVAVENTVNFGGGAIWPLEQLQDVAAVAKESGVATYMDGARLFNAVVKTGIAAHEYAEMYDSVAICFTKGLGAPFGSVLAGSRETIQRAWRFRQRIGGGLRQSGFMAAACLYALDHNLDRLTDDHRRASQIEETLTGLRLVERVLPVETNIVIFEITKDGPTAAEIVDRLFERKIGVGAFGERLIRIVTHLGVDDDDTNKLCQELSDLLGPAEG